MEDVYYDILECQESRKGRVTHLRVLYETSRERGEIHVAYGSRSGLQTKDDTYTVTQHGFMIRESAEVGVPEHIAMAPPRDFAQHVLRMYASWDTAAEIGLTEVDGLDIEDEEKDGDFVLDGELGIELELADNPYL